MASDSVSHLPSVGMLYGAFYFGAALSTAFYGVACMQTFFYYVHYQNDPLRTKIFVAVLWALNTIHEALSVSGTYKYIAAGLLDPFSFLLGSPDLVLQLLFTALVAIPSQGFFMYRIYIFTERKAVVPVLWALAALLQLGAVLTYVGKALYTVNDFEVRVIPINELNEKPFTTLGTVILSVSAMLDVLIAMAMTFLLVRSRGAIHTPKTAHLMYRLIIFTINSGSWTAAFAVMTLVLWHVYPITVLYAIPGVPICAVYFNTVLANLNARVYIRGDRTIEVMNLDLVANPSLPVIESARRGRRLESQSVASAQHGAIWKTTEVMVFAD